MKRGPEPGRIYELTGDVVVLGRSSKSDIVLNDNEVSRSHCHFLRVVTDYELHDLDSANGTFVNGQRVREPWLLQSDCIVELGDSITFHFERGSAPLNIDRAQPSSKARGSDHETEEAQVIAPRHYLVLTVSSRGDTHEVFQLTDGQHSLGRDLSNNIVIQEPEVSRNHLRFRQHEQGYAVEDLGSTNGTTLNGAALVKGQPKTLHYDDVLQIGTMISILYTDEPERFKGRIKTDFLPSLEEVQARPSVNRETVPVNVLGGMVNKRKTSILGTGLQPGSLEDHVFIAYARDDWDALVAPLVVSLQDAGLRVWVEQYLKPGQDDWVVAVEQALAECWMMIVVVSPAALESKPVALQYRYFYNREKPIVTLLYKPIADILPPELVKQRSVRLDDKDRTKTFQRLIFEIMHSRKK